MKIKHLLKVVAIGVFTSVANFIQAQIPTNGLLAWYPLDGTAVDVSGNNNNGTIYGPTSTTDRFSRSNQALSFSGYGQYISVSNNVWSNELTLSAWIYINDFGSVNSINSGKLIFFKGPDTGYNQDYILTVGYVNNQPKANFNFGQGSSQYLNITSNSVLQTNQWYLITATRANGVAKLYVNANLEVTSNYSFTPVNQNFNLKLGMSHANSQSFSGKLDELLIYNRALNDGEILSIYNEQPSKTNCLVLKPDAVVGKDAALFSCVNCGYDTANYGNVNELSAISWTNNGNSSDARGIIQFDFSSIPSNAIVTSAKFSLFYNSTSANGSHSTLSGSNACYIQKVTSSWDENTVTWNNQPSTTTIGQISLSQSTSTTQNYTDIDITSLIQDMVNNPSQNFGLMLRLQAEAAYRQLIFASSDHKDSTLHPKLVVCYDLCNTKTPISFNSFPSTYCLNADTVTLSASPIGGSFSGKGVSNNVFDASIAGIGTDTILYVYTDSNGCSSSSSQIVIVNPLPTATITASGATTFFKGDSVILTASLGSNYLWSNGATSQSITVIASETDSVIITKNTCSATSSPIKVTVNVLPENTNCLILQPDAKGKDASLFNCISCGYSTTNYGNSSEFSAISWTNGGSISDARALMEFDFSSIPANAIVISAKFSLFYNPTSANGSHSTLSGSNACYIQKVTSSWDENTVTWNNQPTTTTAGQVSISQSVSTTQNYTDIDIAALIQDMISNPSQNFGLMLRLQTESSYRQLIFASSDYLDSTLHPKLEICYSNAPILNPCTDSTLVVNISGDNKLSSCNGVLEATVTGGAAPYLYAWNTDYRTKAIDNLCPGIYSVKVIDANDCYAKASTVILPDPSLAIPLRINVSTTDAKETCDGSAEVFVSGGEAPYSYLHTNGTTTVEADNLCSGVYGVIVTDAKGNTDSLRYIIANKKDVHHDTTRTYLQDSSIIAKLVDNVIEHCSLDLTQIDSVRIATYSLLGKDSVKVEWKLHSKGVAVIVFNNYRIRESGVYVFILQLNCTTLKKMAAVDTFLKAEGVMYVNTVADITGINEKNVSNKEVFPVPFSTTLNIKLEGNIIYTISMFDLTGKQVLNTMQVRGNTQEAINLEHLQSGFYIMKIASDKDVEFIKVLKE